MIRLQFVADAGLVSAAISYVTHGWCSHVDTVLPDGSLLGARFSGGVAIRPPDYKSFSRRATVELACDGGVAREYHDFLRWQVGKPYDLTADVAFLTGRDWREDDSWMCSELVSAALERAGFFPHQLCSPANKITPADLLLVVSAFAPVG